MVALVAKRLDAIFLVLLLSCLGGLFVVWIARSRDSAARVTCRWNMKTLAMGMEGYHDTFRCYPTAVIPSASLPPEKRFSWLLDMLPNFGEGGGIEAWWPDLDREKAWDDKVNFPIKERNLAGQVQEMSGGFDFLCCPANPVLREATNGHLTMYVGVTGLGEDSASLPLGDPRVGFFGYDRKLTRNDITDGLSVSASIAETGQN